MSQNKATMKTILLIRMIHRVFHNNILVVPAMGYLDELKRLSNLEYRDEIKIAELTENFSGMSIEIQKKEKLLQQEQWAYLSTHPSKRLTSFCYDDDDDDDYNFAITPIDYVEASPSDSELVSSEVMEIVIPEVVGIDDDIPLTIKDDNLHKKLLNVNLLIATMEALNDNPTPSSDCKTKSSSTSLNSLLEETSTFHNSLPEFENFYFDLEEISSGSTTTHSDISLSEYDSFIFDLTHEEFVDELAHIISLPEYDCF
uniref:Reverse transcriptase domain-containing protein n=1 Tax=Tanacetum cinerariifolium TaxID=118510 RepID=A0A6L2J440_TANCI|nr:hypothetical protein [Tanacetum cinerariifolium]